MDDIWRKAAKKIRENDRRVKATQTSQPEVKPTVIATSTVVPTHTNTSAALNTVVQCDARLLQMENEWKLTQSGPFPDGIRNAIANLRTALAIQEAEASEVENHKKSGDEDAVRREESEEKGEEKSGRKAKKILGFNWAEDVNASIGLINIAHNKLTPVANVNTSDDASPIAHVETTPIASVENTSIDLNTTAIPIPCDLSGLCSGTPNPWGSLRCRRCGRYPHASHQFTHRKQHPMIYPANTYLHTTTLSKPPISTPIRVFETIRHPYGIGPTKPVVRVPVSTTAKTLTYPAPCSRPVIAKPTSPLTHPAVAVQCRCGQLVHVSPISQLPTTQLHRTFPTLISDMLSHSFSLPSQIF